MVDLSSVMSSSGIDIPNISGNIGDWILIFAVAVVFMMLVGIIVYFIFVQLLFNKKVILFKRVNSKMTMIGSDKAKFERLGLAGDYWMVTKKFKKILPRPKIEINKNTFWYYEREDGEWINFTLHDIDEQQHASSAYYVDEDMRLQRLGIQRNLKERFDKPGFWAKYGQAIMFIISFLVLTICLIVIFNKINDLVKALPALADSLREVALVLRDIHVQTQGGLVSVTNSTSVGLL